MMMYDLQVAWRSLRQRPIETAVPVLVVSLAIALSVAVFVLSDGAEEGIVRASDPFGVLVIGSAGSGQELVLSSVLLQGNPIGNIPYDVYETLENDDARVRLAVPLAFGDSVGGARIIGTNRNFFELRASQSAPPAFQLAEGRFFEPFEAVPGDRAEAVGEHQADGEHAAGSVSVAEVVIGSQAAVETGLQIGDRFLGTHGVGVGIAENVHSNLEYEVVGILEYSGTAYDAAVYTPLEAVWYVHHQGPTGDALPTVGQTALMQEQSAAPTTDQVTAVLVLPTGFIEQNQLAQEFYTDPTLQAAFPGEQLGNLINLLNQGQRVLEVVGYVVLAIAGLTLFLSMYSSVLARQQSIAIMRGIGTSRLSVSRIIVFETLIVSIVGALLGRVFGYLLAAIIAQIYSAQSAIPIPVRFLTELEVILWTLSIGVGVLAGLIPALMAYRVNVVERLFPA